MCFGFGIANANQAKEMAAIADGVIVGSAIVKMLEEDGTNAPDRIGRFIREMKDAIS